MRKIVKIGVAAAAVAGIGYLAYRGLKKLVEKANCCGCCDGDCECECHCHDSAEKCHCECNEDVDVTVEEVAEPEVVVATEEATAVEEQ